MACKVTIAGDDCQSTTVVLAVRAKCTRTDMRWEACMIAQK